MSEQDAENVGTAVKQLRLARGYSVRSLAKQAGISAATVSRWESQKRVPSIPELDAVFAALEVTTAQKQTILRLVNAPRAVLQLRAFDETGLEAYNNRGGDLLWAMRQRKGWTQTETARAADVTQSQIAEWEGGMAWPGVTVMHTLCWVLNARPAEVAALSGNSHASAGTPLREASKKWDKEAWNHYVSELLFRPPPADVFDLTLITAEQQLSRLASARSDFAGTLLADLYAVHARHHLYRQQGRQAAHWAERGLALVRRRQESFSSTQQTRGNGSLWFANVLALASYAAQSKQPAGLRRAVRLVSEWLPAVEQSDPTHYAWGQMTLANNLGRLGRVDEAVALGQTACKKAERVNPGDGFMRWRDFAGLLLHVKKPAQALRALHQSETLTDLRHVPFDTVARHRLMEAECFWTLGDTHSAGEQARTAEHIIAEQKLWYLQDDLRRAFAAL